MNKSCVNCYWRNRLHISRQINHCMYYQKTQTEVCDNHSFLCEDCESDSAEWDYMGKRYCSMCALQNIGIEKREYVSYQYYDARGDYLGDSGDMDDDDILSSRSDVKGIEEELK